MSKLPYMQFYPSDWLTDPSLRAVTPAAKGLWIDMLCLMWTSPVRGELRFIPDVVPALPQLSRELRVGVKLASRLLSELESAGVLSRTSDGAFCSRRMLRDEELRRKRTAAGHQGGNPVLVKQKVNQPVKQIPDVLQSHISESESDKGHCPTLASPSSAQTSEREPLPSVDLPTESPHIAELLDAATNELIATWNGLRGVRPHSRNWLSALQRATLEGWLFGPRKLDWHAVLELFPLKAFPPGVEGVFQPTLGWLMQDEHAWDVLEGKYDFVPGQKAAPAAASRTRPRLGELQGQGGGT